MEICALVITALVGAYLSTERADSDRVPRDNGERRRARRRQRVILHVSGHSIRRTPGRQPPLEATAAGCRLGASHAERQLPRPARRSLRPVTTTLGNENCLRLNIWAPMPHAPGGGSAGFSRPRAGDRLDSHGRVPGGVSKLRGQQRPEAGRTDRSHRRRRQLSARTVRISRPRCPERRGSRVPLIGQLWVPRSTRRAGLGPRSHRRLRWRSGQRDDCRTIGRRETA